MIPRFFLLLAAVPTNSWLQRPPTRGTFLSAVSNFHVVSGIECREVTLEIKAVGPVTILEATAAAQETLVDMALELEEEDDDDDDDLERSDGTNSLKAGDPYGAVLWPAASAIANYLMTNCSFRDGGTLLELGTGTGLVSLAASLSGRFSRVIATDYEQVPLSLLEYAQEHLNPGGKPRIETALLDICDTSSTPLLEADVMVAADVMYEPKTGRAMAQRVFEALQGGRCRVLVGDSPGRAGRPAFLDELKTLGIRGSFVNTVGQTCSGPRHELICGNTSTSVSATPKDLAVAIMDLDPRTCLKGTL